MGECRGCRWWAQRSGPYRGDCALGVECTDGDVDPDGTSSDFGCKRWSELGGLSLA